MNHCLIYLIAFCRPGSDVYREQAKLLIDSIYSIGKWQGEVIVFTNDVGLSLKDELPNFPQLREVIVPFDKFDHGKDGKLPACRFRMNVGAYFHAEEYDWILYLDCDCLVRRRLDEFVTKLSVLNSRIVAAQVKNRNMARNKWFNGHITEEHEKDAARCRGVQAGTVAFAGQHFESLCAEWQRLDRGPGRKGSHPHHVTDQSSLNLFHLICATRPNPPSRFALFPFDMVACPHQGQRKALGHETINTACIWHFWHLSNQQDRVVAMSSELDRLKTTERQRIRPLERGMLGTWSHTKPEEKITNQWTFHEDGLITVDTPAICGRWELRSEVLGGELKKAVILIDWLWGWEEVNIMPAFDPLRRDLNRMPDRFAGESFRGGKFTLERVL